jgi:hypothetical protein
MELVPSNVVLVACLLSLLVMVRVRRSRLGTQRTSSAERLDTVLAWPPTRAAALNAGEREAYRLLRTALPDDLILAHVSLARFVRVPARRSQGVWLKKAGRLSVDLLLCAEDGLAIAAVELRAPDESDRAAERRARVQRVLQAAGIPVHVWTTGRLPDVDEARSQLSTHSAPEGDGGRVPTVSALGDLAR